MVAPAVASLSVTDCAVEYVVEGDGEKLGAAAENV
jgi:hypothetical protein